MTGRLRDDDRGTVELPAVGDTIGAAVVVFSLPLVVALAGALQYRADASRYAITAVASLLAIGTLLGLPEFATRWTVVGICATLAAIGSHVWQFREDRQTLLLVGGIYATPIALAVGLLFAVLL